ncbi:phage terminase small subunit P27 family [Clostridium botulinum]|nr:phage terminase small subunit P27 family [Clostridium botulinum]
MARPCKAINTQNRHNTKDETEIRDETEKKLRGLADKIKPPKYLSNSQKKIFKYIVNELKDSEILSNLDIYILTVGSIAIDRLQAIEIEINNDFNNIYFKELMKAKAEYTKDLWRACNELSLSPQSRAKLGSLTLNSQKEKKDPILSILERKKKGNINGHKG